GSTRARIPSTTAMSRSTALARGRTQTLRLCTCQAPLVAQLPGQALRWRREYPVDARGAGLTPRRNDMPSEALRDAYQRDGFIVVSDLLGPHELTELRQVIADLIADAAAVDTHTAVYDLEPGHTRAEPKVRRIKSPHKVHPAFDAVVRRPAVM